MTAILKHFSTTVCVGDELLWELVPSTCVKIGNGIFVKAECGVTNALSSFSDVGCTQLSKSFGAPSSCATFGGDLPPFFASSSWMYTCPDPNAPVALDLDVTIQELHQETDGSNGGATVGIIFAIFAAIIFCACAILFVAQKKMKPSMPVRNVEAKEFDSAGPEIATTMTTSN